MKLVKEIEFHAKTENEAFRKVRERLGSDGVILSMQTVKEPSVLPFFRKKYIFVRAGILEEEKRVPLPPDPELEKRQQAVFQALLHYKSSLKEAPPKTPSLESLAESVEDRVELVCGEDEADAARSFESPGREDGYPGVLLEQDVPGECVEKLWEEFLHSSGREETFARWLGEKAGEFCVASSEDPLQDALGGNRIMVVGPTGVGKTTTIAKIAAMAVMEGRKAALFTSDNYRVSAVDQIRTFARVLGIPIEVVNAGFEIPGLLEKYDEDTLILMDTVGCGFRETGRLSQVEDVWKHFEPDAVHIALSVTSRLKDIQVSVETTMRAIPVSRVIMTKLDETSCPGAVLWVPMTFGLPLSFLATGQNVPRDIELATGRLLAETLLGEAVRL